MKNQSTLTFKASGSFNLNGTDLSRGELSLLLDLLGFQVDQSQDDKTFFDNTLISLRGLTTEEFERVYEDFVIWKGICDFQREQKVAA